MPAETLSRKETAGIQTPVLPDRKAALIHSQKSLSRMGQAEGELPDSFIMDYADSDSFFV